MGRRFRPTRENFSFDSFLDLVTNVVGIIIRLILVVWVGARSYTGFKAPTVPDDPAGNTVAVQISDPLERELARMQQELLRTQAKLLEELRHLQLIKSDDEKTEKDFADLDAKRQELQQARADLEGKTGADKGSGIRQVAVTLADIQKRREKLTEEIHALEKLPPLKKALRYRTPVSQPVHAEEWHFECRAGRVAFIDVSSMLAEVRQTLEDKGKQLQAQWEVSDATEPVGAFRMRYVIERQRRDTENIFEGASPQGRGGFGYGLSEWHIEAVQPMRGETAEAALAPRSEFRHVIDGLSSDTAVVTFWVYPDSFPIYRQLRDYLADHDITVAGRPLPEGVSISCSRRGSLSRGQ